MSEQPAPDPHADAARARPPVRLCAGSDLVEGGRAWTWDVLHFGQPARAFALRFDGRVVGYLNRCLHVPTEMDWQPGEFLDSDRRFIVCSLHGATYEPTDGRCVGGPCGRGRLVAMDLQERPEGVHWYPSRDTRPVPAASGDAPSAPSAAPPADAPEKDAR